MSNFRKDCSVHDSSDGYGSDHPSLHNGEPESANFCYRLGLDYVSSKPMPDCQCAPGGARAESGIEKRENLPTGPFHYFA